MMKQHLGSCLVVLSHAAKSKTVVVFDHRSLDGTLFLLSEQVEGGVLLYSKAAGLVSRHYQVPLFKAMVVVVHQDGRFSNHHSGVRTKCKCPVSYNTLDEMSAEYVRLTVNEMQMKRQSSATSLPESACPTTR